MTSRERVQEWIEWSRQNLPETEHCPELDVTEIKGAECPWWSWESLYYRGSFGEGFFEESNREERDEFLILFEDQLSRDPGDVSIRFTALNFHCRLLFHYDSNVKGFCDAVGINCEEGRKHVAKNLAYLVRLLPVDACTDWRAIRWEICNAYYIRDWERAGRLYDRLVALDLDVPNQAERHLLWGQFHFLRVLGPKINPKFDLQSWKLGLYDSYDRLHIRKEIDDSVILLFMGLVPQVTTTIFRKNPKEQITLDDAERDRICDAAHDLRKGLCKPWTSTLRIVERTDDAANDLDKGLTNRADIRWPAYCSMLAGCYFATGDFDNAAKNYEQALVGCERDFRQCLIYQSIATSYQQAGDTEKAKDALKQCADKFPNAKGIYKELARIQAQETDYHSAYESLTKELERDPTFGEDWLVSTALALGAVGRSSEQIATHVESHLRSNPQISASLESLLRVHWPSVDHLTDKAREKWIGGSYIILNLPVDVRMNRVQAGAAAPLFATAVELELKAKVFEKFRDHVSRSSELRSLAKQESSFDECKLFCRFLAGGKMTLGQMHYVLRDCRDSKRDILRRFNHWVQKNRPLLLKKLRVLEKIYGIRGPAVHGSISKEDAERMPHLCRDFLSELLPSPQHETS